MPVLLGPAIAGLNLKPDGWYVDGTFGRGGHSGAILENLGSEGRLLAIDRDPMAIKNARADLKRDSRLELINGEFSEVNRYAIERNVLGKVDGLLLDLGVSSPQLDEAERGFSFRSDGPLDMRMDPSSGQSAADWLARVEERTLRKVLQQLGEERNRLANCPGDCRCPCEITNSSHFGAGRDRQRGSAGPWPETTPGNKNVSGDQDFHQRRTRTT